MRKRKKKMTDSDTLEDVLSGAVDPFREVALTGYKELLDQRTILINGDIEENIIERVVVQIEKMSKIHPKTPITIMINSYGGSLFDGQAVVDAIRSTKTPITTIALGKAMSAAFNIFLAGDLRIVHENSILLAHCGSQDVGEINLAHAVDEAKFNEQLFERASDYYASRTKIPKKEWLDLMNSGKDRYFWPEEAVKKGIAHNIETAPTNKYYPQTTKRRKARKLQKKKRRGYKKRKSR